MNKGGDSELLLIVILAVLIISVTASLFLWINNVSSGKFIQAQVDAKESALIVDTMRSGTTLIINKTLHLNGNNLVAEFGGDAISYSIFNSKVSLQKVIDGVEVKA
ncbi:MAG: hypothetical protein KKE23_02840 [Nanoarchaeota archaeon]|nr:hypothetical protein [Nanoarchaeota archaeon]